MHLQERLKKTNKLVKKPAKAVTHSKSTGELGADPNVLQPSGPKHQLSRNDRSQPNFTTLLKSFGSAKRASVKANGTPSGLSSFPLHLSRTACMLPDSVRRCCFAGFDVL